MKLQIEFDAADFKSMIVDFFAEAGFQMSAVEEVRIQTLFKEAFPESLRVNAEPANTEVVVQPISNATPPFTSESYNKTLAVPQVDDPEIPRKTTFSLADLHDPTYSEDAPKIQNILTLSRSLEKAPR